MSRTTVETEIEPKKLPLSVSARIALIMIGCLQHMISGGIIYGWAAITKTLMAAPPSEGGAGLTLSERTTIFAAASSIFQMAPLPMGFIYDYVGPRTCSIVANALVGIGCIIFANAQTLNQFIIGASVFSFGGAGIQFSLVHLRNLFPAFQNLVMSGVMGMITLSFGVLPLMGAIWEKFDVDFRTLFGVHGTIVLCSSILSFFIWPDVPFDAQDYEKKNPTEQGMIPLSDDKPNHFSERVTRLHPIPFTAPDTKLFHQSLQSYLRSGSSLDLQRSISFFQSRQAVETGDLSAIAKMSLKDLPFLKQVSSGSYVRMTFMFTTTNFISNLYIASLATELGDQGVYNTSEQHILISKFSVIMAFGIIGSFSVGFLLDTIGLMRAALITLCLGQIQYILIIFCGDTMSLMPVSFCIYTLFRAFMYPCYFAGLVEKMGLKYFGILSGIGFLVSGLTQIIIVPIVLWAEGTCHQGNIPTDAGMRECNHGKWMELNVIQVCILFCLLPIPILDNRMEQRRKKVMYELIGSPKIPHMYERAPSFYGATEYKISF